MTKKSQDEKEFTLWGNPILDTPTKEVPVEFIKTEEIQGFIDTLFEMAGNIGIGLAANQIGSNLRIAIVQVLPEFDYGFTFPKTALINPKITRRSRDTVKIWDGCLSFPGVAGLSTRSRSIDVEYFDREGSKHIETIEGIVAIIFQHEIDHLDGVRYIERVENPKDVITADEYLKKEFRCEELDWKVSSKASKGLKRKK